MSDPLAFDPLIGQPESLAPGPRRIVAPNPSPMTFRGTNTYLLGSREIAVIDPGPNAPSHLRAILDAVGLGQRISHIIVSHAHLDHSPLADPLAAETGAPILAFGDARSGRSAVMQSLGEIGGGEGIDAGFAPHIQVTDGERIAGEGWVLDVLHTPGHLGNHICLAWGQACFTADHVMGWATSLISPPDGDLTDFMGSCARLSARDWSVFYPGHGGQITEPNARLNWLIKHRQGREAAILQALRQGAANAIRLTAQIYTETPPGLMPAATRNVLAHLIHLYGKKKVFAHGELGLDTVFERV